MTYENCKFIAKRIHTYLHNTYSVVDGCMRTVTYFDTLLYSAETRAAIQACLSPTVTEDANLYTWLQTPEATRANVYHFCIKGSNCMDLLLYYLRYKYEEATPVFPRSYESDWDTTILVNPALTERQFTCVFETLVQIVQKGLLDASHIIARNPTYKSDIQASIAKTLEFIHAVPEYEAYRKYPIVFKEDDALDLKIHDATAKRPDVIERVARLGKAGPGLLVTSNKNGGIHPKHADHMQSKFFLGRIMANVVASRDMRLPVEVFDISMNYQNDDLWFSWESYSEYHIVVPDYGIDFRVISPIGLYADLVKCLYNSDHANAETRKNKATKLPARIARIQRILDEIVIPYGNKNATILSNLERHSASPTLVGSIVRRMKNTTRRRPRNIRSYYNEDYVEDFVPEELK
jgi:hypothetical protein